MTELANTPRRKQWIIIGLVIAAIGLGLSIYSTLHHIEVKANGQTDAACNINETFSCDSVALSEYSEVFGIPLGVYGLGYFLGCALLLGIGFMAGKTAKEHLHAYAAMVVVGLLTTLVLGGLSYFTIGALCLSCIGIYILTILQGIALFIFKKEIPADLNANSLFSGGTTAAIALAAVIAVFSFSGSSLPSAANDGDDHANSEAIPTYSKSTHDITISKSAYSGLGEDYRKGNDNAKVVIQEFADFQCPACARVASIVNQISKEYQDSILVVFRNYPLDKACNSSITRELHQYACKAAVMARCAGTIGQFWQYHDKVFEQQDQMQSDTFLKKLGTSVGLSDDQINNCWSSKDILAKIKSDVTLANKIEVNSTPTLFINGKQYLGSKGVDSLRAEINKLLAQ